LAIIGVSPTMPNPNPDPDANPDPNLGGDLGHHRRVADDAAHQVGLAVARLARGWGLGVRG